MANYYSNPNPSFTPYIEQYDDDLLLKGLALKQSQYETNYARIQSSLDKADELEILNPFQQQYKDTKLKEVTSKLNQISGSDFSSNAIVNNALGIASTVAKDPIVSSGLLSTQRIKAQMADRKRLLKDGKYNDITEWYDNRKINDYVNSQDVNASYQGKTHATEWKDVVTILENRVKEKEPDLVVNIGNYGQVERYTDKIKSRTPQQIQAIVDLELRNDPSLSEMIGIIGQYNYRGVDGEGMLKYIDEKNKKINDSYDEQVKSYEEDTAKNNKNAVRNAEMIKQLREKQAAWSGEDGYFGIMKKDIGNGDLDRVKATLQTQDFLNSTILKYTKNEVDRKIDVPDVVKFDYQRKQDAFANKMRFLEYQSKERERAFNQQAKMFELDMKYDANGNLIHTMQTNTPDVESYSEEKHLQRTQELDANIEVQKQALRKQWDKVTSNNPSYNPSTYNPRANKGLSLQDKKDIDFNAYMVANEYARENNMVDRLDPYYMDWYNQNRDLLGKQGAYKEITDEINKGAEQFKLHGGLINKKTGVYVDHLSEEAEAVKTLTHAVDKTISSNNTYNLYINQDDVLANQIETYRNRPLVYNKLKTLASKGFANFKEMGDDLTRQEQSVFQQRRAYRKSKYKEEGVHVNDQNVIPNKKQEDELKAVFNSIPEQELVKANVAIDKKKDNFGVMVTSYGRDVNNKFYINVKDAKGKDRRLPTSITNSDKFIPNNPYQYIDEQLARKGHTSYSPKNALQTSNGKLSYGIDTDVKGKYVFIIGPGGTPIKTEFRADVARVDKMMNLLATSKNKTTNQPFTRAEIIEMLNNPDLIQNIEINAK